MKIHVHEDAVPLSFFGAGDWLVSGWYLVVVIIMMPLVMSLAAASFGQGFRTKSTITHLYVVLSQLDKSRAEALYIPLAAKSDGNKDYHPPEVSLHVRWE